MSTGTRGEIGGGGQFKENAKGQIIANMWDRRV